MRIVRCASVTLAAVFWGAIGTSDAHGAEFDVRQAFEATDGGALALFCPSLSQPLAAARSGVGAGDAGTAGDAGVAGVLLNRSGDVNIQGGGARDGFAFDVDDAGISIVRLEWVTSTTTRVLGCGVVGPGRYVSPAPIPEVPNSALRVRLYSSPREREVQAFKKIAAERVKALATDELVKAEVDAWEAAAFGPLKETVASLDPDDQNTPAAFRESLNNMRPIAVGDDFLTIHCDANAGHQSVDAALQPVDAALCKDSKKWKPKIDDLENATPRLAAKDKKTRITQWELIKKTVAALPDGKTFPEAGRQRHCETVAKLRTYAFPDFPRLIYDDRVPVLAATQTKAISFGAGKDILKNVEHGKPLALLFRGVPTGETASFMERHQELPDSSFAESFEKLIQYVLPLAVGVKAAASPWSLGSFICGSTDPLFGFDVDAAPPEANPALAPQSTASYTLPEVLADQVTDVFACNKDPCVAAPGDASVRNQVTVVPKVGWRFPLLFEIAGTLSGSLYYASPRYDPVTGADGPDQIFELRQAADFRQGFSGSLGIGFRPPDCNFIFGPTVSIFVGHSLGVFNAVGFRGGWEFTKGAVLTGGLTARFVPYPREPQGYGTTVAVPVAADGTVKAPPAPPTSDIPYFGLSIGLALDMSELADAGDGLLKALKVKQ